MVSFSHRGVKLKFDEGTEGGSLRRLRQGRFYEGRMLDYIRKLHPKHVVIDVGANIGNHSVYFAAFTDCNQVIALEAHPKVFKTLTENIRLNALQKKIRALNVAAGDTKGRVGLEEPASKILGGTRVVKGNLVDMRPLDQIVGKDRISLMKIDVEGFEVEVLKGARKLLKNQSPDVFVEIWSASQKRNVDQILKPLGYSPVRVFNSSATYYYKKGHSFAKTPKGLYDFAIYLLSKHRIFRHTS